MLVSFSVQNYRSFRDEQVLNMVAANKLSDHADHCIAIGKTGKKLLRMGMLFGANASGKSNLVRAMFFAQQLIRSGSADAFSDPFRLQDEPHAHATSFEFRFLVDEHIFTYGFDIREKQISEEWLAVGVEDSGIDIFTRDEHGRVELGKKCSQALGGEQTGVETLKAWDNWGSVLPNCSCPKLSIWTALYAVES
jgi:uncharacterized protein